MKRFKLWQKTLLFGCLCGAPLAAALFWELAYVRAPREMGQAPREIAAVEIQIRLIKLIHELQLFRDLGHGVANTNLALQPLFEGQNKSVQQAARQASEVINRVADAVDVQVEWKALQSQLDSMLKGRIYENADRAFRERSKLLAETRALLETAGDRSKLSEESVGERYRLMTVLQYKGPELLESLANARAIGASLTVRQIGGQNDNLKPEFELLREEAGRIEASLKSTEGTLFHSIERVMEARPEFKPALSTAHQLARAATDEAARLARRIAAQERADVTAKEFHDALTRATGAILQLEDKAAATLTELLKARVDSFTTEVGRLLGALALCYVVVFIVGTFVIRDITKPLHDVVSLAGQIAAGDLTANVAAVERTDDIGGLLRALNRMVNSLTDIVGQVQKSGLQVNTSVNQISVTGKQQQATANEIATTTTEIGATAKEISSTSLELVNMMKDATAVAEDTAALANKGQEGLTRMRETMTQLTDAATLIQSKLGVLTEKAANINQVVTTITKIADRTNLLSLNAAIEAEKAGEYGRGFSVVATEIRRLADQTAVATYDIEQMVKEMQAAVSAGTLGMNQTAEDIRNGVKEVQAVGAQLAQIIQQVQALAPRFEMVNSGMQSQATGGQQISDSLSQLTKAVHQTAQSLEQSNQAIEQLKNTAYALREGVARFKLPGSR